MNYAHAFLWFSLAAQVAAESIDIQASVEQKNQASQDFKNIRQEWQQAQHDLLEKKELSPHRISEQFSDEEIANSPELMEKLFVQALVTGNKKALPPLIELYQKQADRDESLIEWGQAILLGEEDLEGSIRIYRQLIGHFPDNDYIRFQLAHALFMHQEYEAARGQFEKLRSSSRVSDNDREVFEQFMLAIDQKDRWNFFVGGNYLSDDNLGNTAKPGTQQRLENGAIINSGERHEGRGFALRFGADKQWSLGGGHYISLENSNQLRYYWNNKKFNELNLYFGLGFGHRNPQFQFEIMPNFSKKLYGGGSSGDGRLHSHYNSYGLSLSGSRWMNPNLRYAAYYSYDYDQYSRDNLARQNNGSSHSLTQTLTYYRNPKQYWSLSLDLSRKNAKIKNNAYNRGGLRLGWGQEWPWGISSYSSIGFAQRSYLERDWHGFKQKNKEYNANVALWHKAIHYAGLTPRLSFSYHKTDSNVAIFSYDKFQAFLEISKSF